MVDLVFFQEHVCSSDNAGRFVFTDSCLGGPTDRNNSKKARDLLLNTNFLRINNTVYLVKVKVISDGSPAKTFAKM